MPLFGTNGIRGILNESITPELGYKDNAIRDYYNLVNRTIKFDELQISNGSTTESIRS
ncbi:MAG: hypothetical protein M1161_03410 [Candidatus Thermoplasmatota archaeon]|nr:hypothetical protein [Candidatus Thermoplasmatota archaeon]